MTKRNPIPPGRYCCIDCPEKASKSTRPCSNSNIFPPSVAYFNMEYVTPPINDINDIKAQIYAAFDMEYVTPPGYSSRPPKEPLEPDWNTPSALAVDDYNKPNNTATWLALTAIAFALGAFCAMVTLSKWP